LTGEKKEKKMSRADTANKLHESYNCAQSVLTAFAEDLGMDKSQALAVSVGFGGGMGRTQETCGAVTGALMTMGLASGFKEGDTREKINAVYPKVRSFIDEFTRKYGTVKCRDLIGCNLLTDEGQKYFKEHNLKENCQGYIRFCSEQLEKYLKEGK